MFQFAWWQRSHRPPLVAPRATFNRRPAANRSLGASPVYVAPRRRALAHALEQVRLLPQNGAPHTGHVLSFRRAFPKHDRER